MANRRQPLGIVGVFLLLLGAGLVLDGDRVASGTLVMLAGAACLASTRRGSPES